LLLILSAVGSHTAPAQPAGKPSVRLGQPVEIAVDELERYGAALLADNESIVVVGRKGLDPGPGEPADPDIPPPGAAIVSLKTKAARRFTNGHISRISSVAGSADGAYIVTAGTYDLVGDLRVWDAKAGKALNPIDVSGDASKSKWFSISCLNRSPRVAVARLDKVSIIDLTRPVQRFDLTADYLSGTWPDKLAISPDDKYLACTTGSKQVVIWDLATKKVLGAPSLIPEGEDVKDWSASGLCFTKSGMQLIASREKQGQEVPKGTPEAKVPANRWPLVMIDIPSQKITPLGMGNQCGTLHFALHPSGDWVATVGPSWSDKPIAGDPNAMTGEIRVYHFPTRTLVHKVQCDPDPDTGFYPSWVGFTPDGKKLVAVSHPAKIRAWDFTPVKP
jgi:WD40 repeat protein